MEYEITNAGPCLKTIAFTFSREDVDNAFDEGYQEINNYVQIKGFRKGKAPRRALEKRFATEAASSVKEILTERNVGDTVKKENLLVIGNITTKNANLNPIPGHEFILQIDVEVAPEFDLPEYTGLELKSQPDEVTDDKVDETLDRYRKMFANYEKVDEPAKVEDVLRVDFVAKVGEQEITNMQDKRLRVGGDRLFDLPYPELESKFTGAKAGDVVTLAITLPEDHPEADLSGKEAQIDVSVKEVERGELPERDDQFAQNVGMKSLADFRDRIRANLVREAMMENRRKQEEEVLDMLLPAAAFEVSESMVEREIEGIMEQRHQRLARAGVGHDAIHAQLEEYKPEARKEAERKLRWGILASRIGDHEKIAVTNEDMSAQIEALAQSYNTTPAKIVQRIREFNGIGPMAAELLSIKVMQFIIDSAKGGRLDPAMAAPATEQANADAMQSVAGSDDAKAEETKSEEENAAGE